MNKKNINRLVKEMRDIAEIMVNITFPQVPLEDEKDTLWLKQTECVIGGYEVALLFSKSRYPQNTVIETLQVHGLHTPFLPFSLVMKLGLAFLGGEKLTYTDHFLKNGQKIYLWTLSYRDGNKILPQTNCNTVSYENVEYKVLSTGAVNFQYL